MSQNDIQSAQAIIACAGGVARQVQARAVMAYASALPDPQALFAQIEPPARLILIHQMGELHRMPDTDRVEHLEVPRFQLTRMDQIKMATVMAFSQRILDGGDSFVALTGVAGHPVDTMVVMRVGAEHELFQTVGQPKIIEHVRRVVFQRVLTIALEIANEGREGKATGALFVIGSMRELRKYTEQHIINPFRGYLERERNILDERLRETIKEFASIDGAFVIKGNGVIVSAGTTLRPDIGGEDLPQGLGARHATAAAITASTRSIAITVSESTGTVRLWRRGKMLTEIEKAPRTPFSAAGQ
ncbi:MAG TPA: diadenylate cyclase [Phycisphaerae bacterium]|nr:diadenylate cyclase [Phycisphaerae bacterium]